MSPDSLTELLFQADTVSFATGNYIVSNVGTGNNLYFERIDTVGVHLGTSTVGVNLEPVTYNDVTGTSVSGIVVSGNTIATTKCLAAQCVPVQRSRPESLIPNLIPIPPSHLFVQMEL